MNSFNIFIPYYYALKIVELNWNDILFGINNGFFDNFSAVEHAIIQLEQNNYPSEVLEIACLTHNEAKFSHSIHPFIDILASKVSEQDKNDTNNKFLYIVLKFMFDLKENYEDPFNIIDLIYADFDYPKHISNLVSYIPSDEPPFKSYDFNVERLYKKWHTYLEFEKERYKRNS